MAAERCSAGRLTQLASTLEVGAPASSANLASADRSKGCSSTCYLRAIVLLAILVTVSIAIQKHGALSMYPIGSERWNTTSCVLLVFLLGVKKATYGTSSIITHNFM